MSIPAAASAASITPSHESLELLRACECPVDAEPLVHAVTLIPCCHKINQAVAEAMYGRMAGESCENRGRPCALCRAPVIAYYPDPVMRDVAHRALRLAEPRIAAPRVDAIPPVAEPRVLPARRPAEARPDAELRVVAPRVDVAPLRGVEVGAVRVEEAVVVRRMSEFEEKATALFASKMLKNEKLYQRLRESDPRLGNIAGELEQMVRSPVYVPPPHSEIWNVPAIVLYIFRERGHCGCPFQHTGPALKDNEIFVLNAVKIGGHRALMYAANARFRDNEAVALEAVKNDKDSIRVISPRLQDNEIIVSEAVKKDGDALQYASERLRDNEVIVMEAIKQKPSAIQWASERIQTNEAFMLEALRIIRV